MKQLAVEWLVEKLEQNKFITKSQIYIAEEMEKKQKDEFAIEFAEWSVCRANGYVSFKLNDDELEIFKKEKGL